MRIRFVPIAMVLLLLLLVAAACSSDDDGSTASDGQEAPTTTAAASATTEAPSATTDTSVEPVTVTYWHTMSDLEAAQLGNLIATFEAANSGITIEPIRFAYGDFKVALVTGLAGAEGPDTALLDVMGVPAPRSRARCRMQTVRSMVSPSEVPTSGRSPRSSPQWVPGSRTRTSPRQPTG